MRIQLSLTRGLPGTILRWAVLCLLGAYGIACADVIGTRTPQPRVLIIGLDAVSYDTVRKLTDPKLGKAAVFKDLKGPSALINAFPTDSHVAWSAMLAPLGVETPPGYEGRYFDNTKRRVIGGFSLVEHPFPWKRFFDAKIEGILSGAIAYGWPKKYVYKEMEDGLKAFVESKKQVFGIYVLSTDALAHKYGPAALEDVLLTLDKSLTRLRGMHPNLKFHTILLSDHGVSGGDALKNTWPDVQDATANAGMEITNKLESQSDVVFIPFGLLNSFVIYTYKGQEEKVASIVSAVKGVDLCVTRRGGGWQVTSSRGTAIILKRGSVGAEEWSYRSTKGDPINFNMVVSRIRSRLGDTRRDWFSDALWFEESKGNFYPDGLYRIGRGFDLVKNPASVICSNSPGYMFGAKITEYVAKATIGSLKWTHGALDRDASLGFTMSDLPNWDAPEFVRFDQTLIPLVNLLKSSNQ